MPQHLNYIHQLQADHLDTCEDEFLKVELVIMTTITNGNRPLGASPLKQAYYIIV